MKINPTEDEKISSKGDSSSEGGCSEDEVEVVTVQIRFTAHILINTANNSLGLKRATQKQSVCEDFTISTNDPSRLLSDPESREKKQTTSAAKLLYFFRAAMNAQLRDVRNKGQSYIDDGESEDVVSDEFVLSCTADAMKESGFFAQVLYMFLFAK